MSTGTSEPEASSTKRRATKGKARAQMPSSDSDEPEPSRSDNGTTTDEEPVVQPRPNANQSAYMRERQANIERNKAATESLRDALAALATNINLAGGSKKAGGSKAAQDKLGVKRLNTLGVQLVKVRRDVLRAPTFEFTIAAVCRGAWTTGFSRSHTACVHPGAQCQHS